MATENQSTTPEFGGFHNPTTTPIPDQIFDELMPTLSGAELKVLLYICRRTFGFKKTSDDISLRQMVKGITTRDGKVLDGGTGLNKDTVSKAAQSLVKKGVIVRNRNRSTERGDEATTYTLKIIPVSENPTPPSRKIQHARVGKPDTQQTVIQDTDQQYVDVVMAQLQKFGVSEKAATQLAKTYPEAYIHDKLEFTEYLANTGSPLVKKNPAGFLRKAIEEDYDPPPDFETTNQREARQEKEQQEATAAAENRRKAEAEFRRVQAEKADLLKQNYPDQPIGDSDLTTETAWNLTQEKLAQQISKPSYIWIQNTRLLQVKNSIAKVWVPNNYTAEWLNRRMYQSIARTLADVLNQDVDVQFISAPEETPV